MGDARITSRASPRRRWRAWLRASTARSILLAAPMEYRPGLSVRVRQGPPDDAEPPEVVDGVHRPVAHDFRVAHLGFLEPHQDMEIAGMRTTGTRLSPAGGNPVSIFWIDRPGTLWPKIGGLVSGGAPLIECTKSS